MKKFYSSRTALLFYTMTFLFIFSLPTYAFFGTSTSNVISPTSTKKLIVKSPTLSKQSATSTVIKIVKPKPIQVSLPPKIRAKDMLISGQYIVSLKNATDTERILPEILKKYKISPLFQYKKAFKGFSAKLDVKKIDLLKKDVRIEFITQDYVVSILAAKKPVTKKAVVKKPLPKKTTIKKQTKKKSTPKKPSQLPLSTAPLSTTSTSSTASMTTSTSPTSTIPVSVPIAPPDPKKIQVIPTGIARIFAQSATIHGTGIGVAVLDTGIDLSHPDIKARIIANTSCVINTKNGNDDNGHGTHSAGIIGALDNSFGVVGVAPESNLISVKVLDAQGAGTWSSVLCGIEWIMNNAAKYNIKVAHMGFGGAGVSDNNCGITNNDPLHQALCQSTKDGMTYIAAAGNEEVDIQTIVPAGYIDTVITVSAFVDMDGIPNGKGTPTTVGEDDTFASFSNFGIGITLGAPGVNILSTGKNGTYYSTSGTSMAAAHVAGAAALYIQSHPKVTWTNVKTALQLSGEHQGTAHADSSGKHPETVLQVMVF